ncbi:MAG: hypothetical protein IT323_16825 [Anaerolineae bacterium]|nr:hypothetical protein [Anaerolineae bacterium]
MLVQDILKEIRALPVEDQKRLMKLMVDLLAQPVEKPTRRRSLRELRGLGKEIWAGVDAQEYIDRQRDE